MRSLCLTQRMSVAVVVLIALTGLPTGQARAQGGVITGQVFIAGGAPCTNMVVWDVWKPSRWSTRRQSTRTDHLGRFAFTGLTNYVHYLHTDAWFSSTNNLADEWFSSTTGVYVTRDSQGTPEFSDIPYDADGFDFTGRPLHTNYANMTLGPGGRVVVDVQNQLGISIVGGDITGYYEIGRGQYEIIPRMKTDVNGRAEMDGLWPDKYYFLTKCPHTNVYDQFHPGVEYYGLPSSYDMPDGVESIDLGAGVHTNMAFLLRFAAAFPVRMLTTNSLPVQHVTVSVRDGWGKTVSTIEYTDADGRATVTKAKPGKNYLFAKPHSSTGQMKEYRGDDQSLDQAWVFGNSDRPPYNASPILLDAGTPTSTNEVRMTLDPLPALTVNVRHGDTGDPLGNVWVSTYGSEGQSYGDEHTDASGQSTPEVLPGYVFLGTRWNGYDSTNVLPTYHSGVLPSADPTRLPQGVTPVLMEPGLSREVTVDMLTGVPVNITVDGGPSNVRVNVSADGVLFDVIDAPAQGGTVTVYTPPDLTLAIEVKPPSGSPWLSRTTTLDLGHTGAVAVVDLDGPWSVDGSLALNSGGGTTPANGGYLEVTRPNSLGGYDSGYVDVQPDGSFSLHGLHTGDVHTITAHPPYVSGGGDDIPFQSDEINLEVGAGPNPTPLTIELERGARVTGNVGQSVGVSAVDGNGNTLTSAVADSDGAFSLTLPGNEEVFLRTEHDGSYPGGWFGPDSTNTVIVTTSEPPPGIVSIFSPAPGLTTNMPAVALDASPGTFRFDVTAQRHGHAVSGSGFVVSTPDGFTIAEGELDPNGSALVTGLPLDTPLAAGAHRDGYRTVWHPGLPGEDDITVVPPDAGTIVIDSGQPMSTNEIRLSLGEPGPSPLISDVSPEIVVTPDPAMIGRDNVEIKITVRNAGPHLSTGTTAHVFHHHRDFPAYLYPGDAGIPTNAVDDHSWAVLFSNLQAECSHTGQVWLVPVETGRYEHVVSLQHAGFDPDSTNSVARTVVENVRGPDDDGDDIPNWFEVQISGTTTGLVAGADGDRDGITNGDEWTLRWDPTVSNAPFGLPSIEPDGQGGVRVVVPSETGRVYTLYRSLDILGSPVWTPHIVRGGTGDPLTIRDPQSATQAWYRAGVRAP
jgi:hypothetical protein